jgi:adenylate cyclase
MPTREAEARIRKSMMCRGCWEVLHLRIFIRGPLSIPFRLRGISTSEMHPNTCTLCEKRFKGIMKSAQIRQPLTILFADLRNYTSLSTTVEPQEMSHLLGEFYEACAEAIWARDGIINKVIGDAVLALFNFPFRRDSHVLNAVEAAIELQATCKERGIDIGVGVHTGETLIGEVGGYLRDFTVIGPVVNLAARLQGAAAAGEILITDEVRNEVGDRFSDAQERTLELKGIAEPVRAYAIKVPDAEASGESTPVAQP